MGQVNDSGIGPRVDLSGFFSRLALGKGRDSDWRNGVVAILGSDSLAKGTGFVASEAGYIVTCSHVLVQAGWPHEKWDQEVRVRFLATGRSAAARVVEGCYRDQIRGDIAILKLDTDLPSRVRVLPLASPDNVEGHQVFTRGYPIQNREGLAGHGIVVGEITHDRRQELQFESTNTTFGFSGGPVWDDQLQRVIGLILAAPIIKPGRRLAYTNYAAKAESIVAVCPDRLKLTPPGFAAAAKPETRMTLRGMILLGAFTFVAIALSVLVTYLLLRPAPELTEPQQMDGLFNVVVADFGEVDDPEIGEVFESDDGRFIADQVFQKLGEGLKNASELVGEVMLQHDYVDAIQGSTPAARRDAAAILAEDVRADIVVYGNIDRKRVPPVFVPEYYVSPRLTGAEESTGSDAFGSEVEVDLPLSLADNRAALSAKLLPRYEALTELIYGLAFFKKGLPDEALDRMELAEANRDWPNKDGKEILYVWLGAAYAQRAVDEDKDEPRPCTWAAETPSGAPANDWACAQAAYDQALSLNKTFARAKLGLGNLLFGQAVRILDGRPVYACGNYAAAAATYEEALGEGMSAGDSAYLDMKTRYNIGLAHANAFFNCGEPTYDLAVKNLSQAIAAYQDEPALHLVRDIGARAYYQLGLVEARAGNYDEAVTAFEQARLAAEPDAEYEDSWQTIRWLALNQKGHAYLALAEAGDAARWADAAETFSLVTAAAEDQQFGDPVVLGAVYLGLGRAQNELQKYEEAKVSLEEAIHYARSADATEARWSAIVQRDGHLALGQALSALATSAESERYHEALAAYSWLVNAHDAGNQFISASDSGRAQFQMGLFYEAQDQIELARETYQDILKLEGVGANIIELAEDRLSALDG